MCHHISLSDQEQLVEKLEIFKFQGRDKNGHRVLRIVGKFLSARFLSVDALKNYLEENIFPRLKKKPFSVLYLHTQVQKNENFPGISTLRSIYDVIPIDARDNLQAIYFVHPTLQAKLFLATFGRLHFGSRLYGKLRYIKRIDYLWDHIRRNEVKIPEFVCDHDEDLEGHQILDCGLESDHPRVCGAPFMDSPVTMYSTRCI
ncbi:hypothetical protein OIU84_006159 [Salix udensis]|uniref:CRAL-TRIO domain-containing protein n=1 Tax=Salix udensis TaxID=889485 RepID=A0AAD6JZS1_9ROSI|nr:hypothetical protein OIU84_006159 [Salix udensis]